MLIRGGMRDLTIVDDDLTTAGNLVRHTLLLCDVGQKKASALARRLKLANPNACATGIDSAFEALDEPAKAQVRRCSCVVDCTGSDAVLHYLSVFPWEATKLFCSISIGAQAKRLFCFMARGNSFPFERFNQKMAKWLGVEQEEFAGSHFPREGVGCWHPVFPARSDDIWLLAAVATQHLDKHCGDTMEDGVLTVFEQAVDETGPCGVVKRATE
jgi:hypothetical protein